jgi:hypothetical protein
MIDMNTNWKDPAMTTFTANSTPSLIKAFVDWVFAPNQKPVAIEPEASEYAAKVQSARAELEGQLQRHLLMRATFGDV